MAKGLGGVVSVVVNVLSTPSVRALESATPNSRFPSLPSLYVCSGQFTALCDNVASMVEFGSGE